jgi:hypothetical protein
MPRSGRTALAAAVLAPALLCLAACVSAPVAQISVGEHELAVEVADSPSERSRGLQGREPLGPDEGMLFTWSDAAPREFAIKEVGYDLDVIFVGPDGRITEILPLSPDGPTEANGTLPARWVVEVRSGWAAGHDVGPGTPVTISLAEE